MKTEEAIDEGIARWYVKDKQQSYVRICTATQMYVVGFYRLTANGPIDCPMGFGRDWRDAFAVVQPTQVA